MIISRHHNGSPHLRRQIREIHSLRTARFHSAPGRAMNLPCPITPHHETVTRLFREKSATGQPPSINSRLHESHFTNPPPRKTARPNHQQPGQTISKLDQSISNPTKPSAARPVHQHDPAAKNCPPAKEPSAGQRTVSRPKNCQPTREPSTGLKTASRPKNRPPAKEPSAGQRTTSQPKPSTARPNCPQPNRQRQLAKKLSTGQRTVSRPKNPPRRPKNHQPTKPPYFRALPSLKALPTLAPRGR